MNPIVQSSNTGKSFFSEKQLLKIQKILIITLFVSIIPMVYFWIMTGEEDASKWPLFGQIVVTFSLTTIGLYFVCSLPMLFQGLVDALSSREPTGTLEVISSLYTIILIIAAIICVSVNGIITTFAPEILSFEEGKTISLYALVFLFGPGLVAYLGFIIHRGLTK